ncbi:MAG: hypothetical protein ACR2K6_10655 [Solirubrobacterales bacterium]
MSRNQIYWADFGPIEPDREPAGSLDEAKRAELDAALRYALDILY